MNKELKIDIASEVFSWIKIVVFAVVFALFFNNFIIINAVIPSGSMKDTIMINDRVLANRLAYTFSEPERGDIIVFPYPDDEETLYIKRVIGLPNETIDIKDGVVYVDGVELEESYLSSNDYDFNGHYEVPEGHYFMMGDNRANSADSRYWENKYLSEDKILGKAVLRYYPNPKFIK